MNVFLLLSLTLTAQADLGDYDSPSTDAVDPVVQKIIIEGNNLTRENIIRREIPFAPGDGLTPEIMKETHKAVWSLGTFTRVDVSARDAGEDKVDAVITVDEIRIPLPYPIIGIDASSGWYLGGGALYPNLFGRGIRIDAGGEIGLRRLTPRWKGYTVIEAPVTYNRCHGERFSYFYTDFWRKDAAISRREHRPAYKQSVRPWRPLTLSLEGGFLQVKAFNPDSITPLPTFCSDTTDQSIFIQPGFMLDYRDDALFPTKGALIVASFTYNPGLEEEYVTQRACSLSVAGYYSLGKTVIAGNIWTYQQIDSIPVYNTIYLGDARRVRGWVDTSQVDQCLTVASIEVRRYFWSTDLPVLGEFKVGGNLFFDLGAAHEPGLPPLYLAKPKEDSHDGLLTGTGFGLTLEAIGFVVKGEIAWGIGAEEGALGFIPLPIRFPVYFGWRF